MGYDSAMSVAASGTDGGGIEGNTRNVYELSFRGGPDEGDGQGHLPDPIPAERAGEEGQGTQGDRTGEQGERGRVEGDNEHPGQEEGERLLAERDEEIEGGEDRVQAA